MQKIILFSTLSGLVIFIFIFILIFRNQKRKRIRKKFQEEMEKIKCQVEERDGYINYIIKLISSYDETKDDAVEFCNKINLSMINVSLSNFSLSKKEFISDLTCEINDAFSKQGLDFTPYSDSLEAQQFSYIKDKQKKFEIENENLKNLVLDFYKRYNPTLYERAYTVYKPIS